MKRRTLICLLLVIAGSGFTSTMQAAGVLRLDSNIGLSRIEPVACRVIRQRITRSDGRIAFKTTRTCTPTCRLVRKPVTLPNGHVVIRQIRACR